MTQSMRTLLLSIILLTTGLVGCIGDGGEELDPAGTDEALDRPDLSTDTGWGEPTEPARFDVLPGVQAFVPSVDDIEISIGIFHPDIEGCDWNTSATGELPERCQLPVVMDAGPYYLDQITEDREHPPTIDWLVPRGYHVVQMSLRGTGESGGCYEFKNPADVEDVDAVIDHIVEQAWSTDKVGMIGRSYDGTGAWAGAASGNEHLETIVPISGAVDGPDLYYKNGTAETRSFAQPASYYLYAYGLAAADPTYRSDDWLNTACPDAAEDWVRGPKAGATGDASSEYWQSRDLTDDILEGYNGSAWVIHGLQDFNVNPSQVVPFTKQMREHGIETLVWLGQWEHAFPSYPNEHRNVRWDWADKVVKWFDFYLREEGEQPYLGVEVEDSQYVWRREASFPPPDVNWTSIGFHGEAIAAEQPWTFTTEPLDEDLRVSGLIRLHLEAIPTTPTGGHVFAELYDVYPDGPSVRLGWGAINLMYHDGGNTDPQPLAPGEPVIAKMVFEPADAHVAEGHQLRLVVHKDGVADIQPSPDPSPVLIGQSELLLPTIEREDTLDDWSPPGLGSTTSGQDGPASRPVTGLP